MTESEEGRWGRRRNIRRTSRTEERE